MAGFTTRLLHGDRWDGTEHGSMHKPIHTSVAFGFERTQDLVDVFQGKKAGYAYGRSANPTVTALEKKVTIMEEGFGSVAFATGMAGINALFTSHLRAGDHVIASRFLFGNTASLFRTFVQLGIEVDFVDVTEARNVEAALKPRTRAVFVETIANPATQVADLVGIGELLAGRNVLYVVDTTMTGSYLFLPKRAGAHVVVNSLTKTAGGHGDALAGAVTDLGVFDWSKWEGVHPDYRTGDPKTWGLTQLKRKGLRDMGGTLAADAAHRISIGLETLALRLERSCANALALAKFLQGHPLVEKVLYPGLSDHPQHDRAASLFVHPGTLLSFVPKASLSPLDVIDRMKVAISSTNLGDNRTLVIPVAPTIFFEMGLEGRKAMGISENLIRVSVGIEDFEDLREDFARGLAG